jgi:hypothetical protein
METEQPQEPFKKNELRGWELAAEILRVVGAIFGMAILWTLEIVRDAYFAILDRFNIRPRRKRASAFPPGRPVKRTAA